MALKFLKGDSLRSIALGSPLIVHGENSLEEENICSYIRRSFEERDWDEKSLPSDESYQREKQISQSPLIVGANKILEKFYEEGEIHLSEGFPSMELKGDGFKVNIDDSLNKEQEEAAKKAESSETPQFFSKTASNKKAKITKTRGMIGRIIEKARKTMKTGHKNERPINIYIGNLKISKISIKGLQKNNKKTKKKD